MKISVTITPNARLQSITKIDDTNYKIKVDADAVKGKANARLISMLAEYFNIPKSSIRIAKGFYSRNKVILIQE